MNSFDGFTATGANAARYIPIFGNSAKIISAYRKYAEPHKKREPSPLGMGQVPLFLLDGELTPQLLKRSVETLHLTVYVVIYRTFDVRIKKKYEDLSKKVKGAGYIKKDGTVAEWVRENLDRLETEQDEYIRDCLIGPIQSYLDYRQAQDAYNAAVDTPPFDAVTGKPITDDINEYLYGRAKAMFPLGIESILEANTKQSAIPKTKFFMDGVENMPPPKGVRHGQDGRQLTLFDTGKAEIDDTITELRGFFKRQIVQIGAVTLPAILTHCAEIGLYKGNITLYAIGAAFRDFSGETAIFYDGVAYWRYTEVQDISTWILRAYDNIAHSRRDRFEYRAAIFYDETKLKERLENVFSMAPTRDSRLDTLGMTTVHISRWIVENLRYPIAFLDRTLHRMLSGSSKGMETALYGGTLQHYDAYFTSERCEWLKSRIPHADTIARRAIKEAVDFDPDTTRHGMSGLPKGHYAPVLYSAEDYIKEMLRESRIVV